MTKLLQKAFSVAAKLPVKDQEAFAHLMLEELASERQWARAFAKSQNKLAKLADEALTEFRQKKTKLLEL
jgi:hypothetical protein